MGQMALQIPTTGRNLVESVYGFCLGASMSCGQQCLETHLLTLFLALSMSSTGNN